MIWLRWATLIAVMALMPFSTSCGTTREKQLSRVAKDWCLTIRASQVIPVYPLTRDIQPGDVFLTMTPIGEEQDLFEEDGFLPLDVHLMRLKTDDQITTFYATRPGEGTDFPKSIETWDDLPGSAFPTYEFEIARSGGLNLAVPIEGIPVGLNYLGSQEAYGSVALRQAQTMGLDLNTLRPLLKQWAEENQTILAAYGADPSDPRAQPAYVRVVARVFRVKSVAVQLRDTSSSGMQLAGGFDLPTPEPGTPEATETAAERYDAIAKLLNTTLTTEFGGKLRVINAARQSIALQETFPAPMVIGYLAYDYLVLPGGHLSAPMPTYQRLAGTLSREPVVLDTAGLVMAWYTADEASREPRIERWMERNLKPVDGETPNAVEFLSDPRWDLERRRMIRELGIMSGL